ncbi:MAG TPA: hypothetical protein VGK77_18285 [Candidatus Binatia bacterium]|jgi:hypothetical protein|nr:hypothetical protein [Candidatus Binatia bacterium]
MRKIVLCATIANKPYSGGQSLIPLQYILGLKNLGFDVLCFETVAAEQCWNDHQNPCSFVESVQYEYFVRIMTAFSLTQCCSLLYDHGQQYWGASLEDVLRFACDADALIVIGGCFPAFSDIVGAVRKRIFIDQDPVYTQLWTSVYHADLGLSEADVLFTVGLNIGSAICPIPTCERTWNSIMPVIDLKFWPFVDPSISAEKITTIASWRGFAPIEYQGEWYEQKAVEFKRFVDLPSRIKRPVEVALSIHEGEEDLKLLRTHGWRIVDPRIQVSEPWSYRAYISQSRAELGIYANAYVKARSGWLSDRSAAYLASGKPVLAQDTGLSNHLPLGTGLIPFTTEEELIAAIEDLDKRYEEHCIAARRLAEAYFSAEKVLSKLLVQADLA